MAITVGEARRIVLTRVRAYTGIAFSAEFVYKILSISQNIINAALKSKTQYVIPQFASSRQLLNIRDSEDETLSTALDVTEAITYSIFPTTVPRTNLSSLFGANDEWFRNATSLGPAVYSLSYVYLGRDLLILSHAVSDTELRVVFNVVRDLGTFSSDDDTFSLDDSEVGFVMDLAEIIFLLTLRISDVVKVKITEFKERFAMKTLSMV